MEEITICPFSNRTLEIVLVDPQRAGDEQTYFPGEVNVLRADVLVLTKLDSASEGKGCMLFERELFQ